MDVCKHFIDERPMLWMQITELEVESENNVVYKIIYHYELRVYLKRKMCKNYSTGHRRHSNRTHPTLIAHSEYRFMFTVQCSYY